MRKVKFEDTGLELVYKNVLTCTICGQRYGHDSIPKHDLCPMCEHGLSKPKGWINRSIKRKV